MLTRGRSGQRAVKRVRVRVTGVETSPSETCATQEIHINGDISFAMQQYLLATGDTEIINTSLFRATVFGIADFWISRLQYNDTRHLFDING